MRIPEESAQIEVSLLVLQDVRAQSVLAPKHSWMQVVPTEELGLKRGMLALALKIPAALGQPWVRNLE
jgi:hypothetical protein